MADKALEVASQISNKQITGIISYWYNGQWINIADTNQRNNMQKSIDNLSGLDKTIAALPHSYYSPDQPTGTSYNDTDRWYKITTGNDGTIKYTPYKWASTTNSWQPMLDKSAIHAFVGSAPASPVEGDFWTDNGTLKQYQKGSWVTIPTEGPQGVAGTSSYIHVAYATSSDGKTGFSTTSFDGAVYIGILTDSNKNDSAAYSDYTWSKMKGADGTDGVDGVPGKPGADGKTSYIHFAYANSSDGKTDFSTTYFDNALYIGTLTNETEADSTTYSDYTWSRLMGAKGDTGADGVAGKDGTSIEATIVTYQASTSGTTAPTGTWSSNVPTVSKGEYLWTKTTWTYSDNTSESGYSVAYIGTDGNDGTNGVAGKDGVGISSTTITYQSSTSGTTTPTGTWSSSIPTVSAGSYLWTKTVWTYTDNTSETGYSVSKMGSTGAKGDTGATGAKGADGVTTYTWIKYATDSSGSNMSDSPTGMTYIGIAYNKTTSTESSTATDYAWSLIKGDQGIQGKTGADGKTSYFHIAYANSSDGSIGFTTSPSTSASYNYMGTYSDYTSTSSTSYSSYTWVAMFDSTKKRNFTTQPTTPYAVGDTWTQSGATYFCTTARDSGAFTASDWTMQQLTITSLDSDIQTNLKNNVKTTGNYKGVTLNDAGLTATAGSTTVAMNSTDGFLITNTSGQVFHVDTDGSLTMQGDITAGNISGVNFAGNNLTLAGILAVTGTISSQFSYTDDDSIKHDGETVISDGGIKTIDTQTMPTTQTNKPVTTYSFDSNGYRVITYKDDDAYKAGTEISSTYFDNNGIRMTMADIKSAYRLAGFSGTSATDNDSTLATIQFGDMLQYASSEVQHSGTPDFKDWFDIVAGIQSHPNLLHNSSLISGTNSWGGLTNGIVYPTNVTHDGNFAICIKSAGESNFFYQDLEHIPDPGNTICVSFWANIVKNDGGVNGGAFIKFNGANQNYTATLTNTETGWQYYAFNPITVPSGTTGIRFSFYNNEHTGNQVYFAQPMVNIGDHTWPYMPTY